MNIKTSPAGLATAACYPKPWLKSLWRWPVIETGSFTSITRLQMKNYTRFCKPTLKTSDISSTRLVNSWKNSRINKRKTNLIFRYIHLLHLPCHHKNHALSDVGDPVCNPFEIMGGPDKICSALNGPRIFYHYKE